MKIWKFWIIFTKCYIVELTFNGPDSDSALQRPLRVRRGVGREISKSRHNLWTSV